MSEKRPSPNRAIPIERKNGVMVISFPMGTLDSLETAGDRAAFLVDALHQITDLVKQTQKPKVLVNFDNVKFAGTGVLAMLVQLNHITEHHNGQFRIAGLQPVVLTVFTVTKLDRVLKVHPTVDDALRAFV